MEGGHPGWGFCFSSSRGLRRILDQKSGEKGASDLEGLGRGSGEKEIRISCGRVPGVSWVETALALRLWLTSAGARAGTILWPSTWNTGLPAGAHPSLRDCGRPFATGTSCQYWRPSLTGRTLDSCCLGLRAR